MLVVHPGSKKLIAVINNRLFIFKPRKASLKDTGRDQSCISFCLLHLTILENEVTHKRRH